MVLAVALAVEATSATEHLLELLPGFIIAASVGVFVAKVGRFPYTIALLLAGVAVRSSARTSTCPANRSPRRGRRRGRSGRRGLAPDV